ncbi:probable membrane-associated kinase regulator 6 isoform X1 [Punica granatum]|uniref:Probable membrane-associated kinase regulator 6 isoform X1 n=1 Tax=Punica granatum TaxID=22663 RepID=A0A6P8E8C2_PUNGR|nr:probable membrane-associated kinase regulator 6 isoform X1 [Punica granatum]
METSKPLAIESFSYSWLSNKRPSLDHPLEYVYPHDEVEECFEGSNNFNFNVSVACPTSTFVHADELFSNGIIRPILAESPKARTSAYSEPILAVPAFPSAQISTTSTGLIKHKFIRRWKRSSKLVLRKCFRCIKPLCHKDGYLRKSVRVGDIDRRVREVRSWHGSPQASPSHSVASYSAGEWSDVESSIYEAVLHCKRSIGKRRTRFGKSDQRGMK